MKELLTKLIVAVKNSATADELQGEFKKVLTENEIKQLRSLTLLQIMGQITVGDLLDAIESAK